MTEKDWNLNEKGLDYKKGDLINLNDKLFRKRDIQEFIKKFRKCIRNINGGWEMTFGDDGFPDENVMEQIIASLEENLNKLAGKNLIK